VQVPEMLVCEALASWVPYLESYLLYNYVSPEVAVMGFWATAVPVYITLLFNVGLHHDPEVDATPLPNGKYRVSQRPVPPVLLAGSASWVIMW
jgi:hypothetical protein